MTMIMKMKIINLVIESKDSFGETNIERFEAEKLTKEGRISFKYKSNIGECNLEIYQNNFRMIRKGEVDLSVFFDNDGNGELRFSNSFFSKCFKVSEGKVDIISENINISYTLYDGEELVNNIYIKLGEE